MVGFQKGFQQPPVSPQTLEVLRLLSSMNYTTKDIAKHLKKSPQAINKHKRKLVKLGLWDSINGVSRGGFNSLTHEQTKSYRIHGVRIYYQLPQGINKDKWKKHRGQFLSLKKIQWSEIKLKNKTGITDIAPRFYLHDKYEARVHANGVLVYFPEIYASTPTQAELNLLKLIEVVGLELNKLFNIDFFKHNTLRIKITNYEIAHLNDTVAKELKRNREKLYINIDGQTRLICDFSLNINEMEAVTVEHGLEDQQAIQGYLKDVLKEGSNVMPPSAIREAFQLQAQINTERAEAERVYAENIKAHVKAVKELGKQVKKLREPIRKKKEFKGEFKGVT